MVVGHKYFHLAQIEKLMRCEMSASLSLGLTSGTKEVCFIHS